MKKLIFLFSLMAITINTQCSQYNPLRVQTNYAQSYLQSNYNSYANTYNYQPNYQIPEYNSYNKSCAPNYCQNQYNNNPAYLNHIQLQEDMAHSFNNSYSNGIAENLEYYFN